MNDKKLVQIFNGGEGGVKHVPSGDVASLDELGLTTHYERDTLRSRVAGLELERDEARAQAASALRHADLLRREMEPCEVHHGARRACGQCLSSAEAHAKDLLAQLATEREAHARAVAALEECLDALDFDNGERPEHACQARGRAAIAATKVTP